MATGFRYVAQRVEHIPQRIIALLRILAAKRQIRRHKQPLLIGHIGLIASTISISHPSIVCNPEGRFYINASKGIKLITGSRIDLQALSP